MEHRSVYIQDKTYYRKEQIYFKNDNDITMRYNFIFHYHLPINKQFFP